MKKVTTALIALSLGLATSSLALADPQRVPVGDPVLDASFIQDFSLKYDLEIITADGESLRNGHWEDRVSHVAENGANLLRRQVTLFNEGGELLLDRVHLADAKTLAPVRVEQIMYKPIERMGFYVRYLHQEFKDGIVEQGVVMAPGGQFYKVDAPVTEAPYDYSIWATLLMSLPLVEGAEYQIPILVQNQVIDETIYIRGLETVTLKSGKTYEAYKVETKTRPWTVWLRKDAPYAVKFSQTMPDGSTQISHLVSN